MKRTKYFANKAFDNKRFGLWKIKNGVITYYAYGIWGVSIFSSLPINIKQISRDKARKLEPKAFKSS